MDPEPMALVDTAEEFKPIPIRRAEGRLGHALFGLRMVVDLQLLTCARFLAPLAATMRGRVLDVGCGEMPFRGFLPAEASYTGIDVPAAVDFGMRRHTEIIAFDGRHIPFPDEAFDHVLCTEVLEHAAEPDALVAEIWRVLRPGGTLVATVPFSARVHHAPHDFHRFTRYRLATLFAGFAMVAIEERGDDLAVIANKLIVVCMRLARPSPAWIWRLPLLVLAGPAALLALGVAHLSLRWGLGSKSDPLGYGIVARKD
jgi:SAM-dependent methyltransferase